MEDEDAKSDICVIPETPPDLNDSDVEPENDPEDDATSEIVHTVTFKCIECTREPKYQKGLERITELRGTGKNKRDSVTLNQSQIIPHADAKAIAFQCHIVIREKYRYKNTKLSGGKNMRSQKNEQIYQGEGVVRWAHCGTALELIFLHVVQVQCVPLYCLLAALFGQCIYLFVALEEAG